MTTDLAKRGKRELIFDVDRSQFLPTGSPCSICGERQDPFGRHVSFVRVREKLGDHSEPVAWLCPDCVARAMIQVERHGLWKQLSGAVAAAVARVLARKRQVVPASAPTPGSRP